MSETEPEGDGESSFISHLVELRERLLKAVQGDDISQRYSFIEEGLPTLIWMTWAQRNMNREPSPARATATAS